MQDLSPVANSIRSLTMDAVQKAQSGHPGMPMGMADVATVLWTNYLKYDASAPNWADRDRFVLSAGHGSMLIYSLLHLSGFAHPTMEEIENFRQLGSPTAGHPENFLLPGVECTTGPLGQGLAMAVGMAMAERHLNAQFGDDLVDHNTWVIAGDGCLMEGINHEAIGLAGHLKLSRLVVFWDDNQITIDGSTDLSTSENVRARFEATGWFVNACDGHDYADIARAIDEAVAEDRPALIACRTMIGRGAPNKQGTAATHGSPLGASEVEAAREELNWQAPPFEIPDQVREEWRSAGSRGYETRTDWATRLDASEHKAEFERRQAEKAVRASSDRAVREERDAGASPLDQVKNAFGDLGDKFFGEEGFYFFGFFESATGEEAPWYLKPYLTFPAIFLGVALSFYGLLQTDVIVLRGDNSPIPGQQGFTLSD